VRIVAVWYGKGAWGIVARGRVERFVAEMGYGSMEMDGEVEFVEGRRGSKQASRVVGQG
jgi:hypothetical protein